MKKLIWPGIIILGIALLIGGMIGFAKFLSTNRFDAQIAALKAKGEPTTLAELLGDPIPNDRNAAGPYLEISALIESRTYEPELKIIDEFASLQGPLSPDRWQSVENALAGTQPLRRLVDKALDRSDCRFEVNMQNPFDTLYPHLASGRRMSRWLQVSALVNAKHGRMDAAVDDIRTQAAFVRSVNDEPFLIHHIWRMAMLGITAETVRPVCEHGSLNEDQARRLFDALGSVDIVESLRCGWQGERVALIHYSDPRNIEHLLSSMGYSATGSSSAGQMAGRSAASFYSRTAMKGDLAAYIRYSTMQMDAAGLSYKDAKAEGLLNTPSLPFYAVISKAMMPLYDRAVMYRYVVEANVSEARVFLALQAYKDRFGAYPATMQELKAKLRWKLPKDPFSGKDLIYKRQAKGFILYSVGPDLKDDGGQAITGDRIETGSKGDIVVTSKR